MQVETREIAIWDRGELQDVRELLAELGIEFSEDRDKDSRVLPTHLLISSGRGSAAAIREIRKTRPSHHFLHLVIIERASRSLSATLEREGCDMVVPAPIHPVALRLIVQRALFSGEHKRTLPRVAIGAKIKLKKGLFSQGATLGELSLRGCGVVTREGVEVRDKVGLVYPPSLSGGRALRLEGAVVGVDTSLRTQSGESSAAIVFHSTSKAQIAAIEAIMRQSAVGPTGHLTREPGTPVEKAATADHPTEASERRSGPRRRYEQAILARGDGKIHSLICCDLSIGGMRVAQDSDLDVGSRVRLAIYGMRGADPVVVAAAVVRQGAESGIGLEFDALESAAKARLQTIVDSLPKARSGSMAGTVVSEVLGQA